MVSDIATVCAEGLIVTLQASTVRLVSFILLLLAVSVTFMVSCTELQSEKLRPAVYKPLASIELPMPASIDISQL